MSLFKQNTLPLCLLCVPFTMFPVLWVPLSVVCALMTWGLVNQDYYSEVGVLRLTVGLYSKPPAWVCRCVCVWGGHVWKKCFLSLWLENECNFPDGYQYPWHDSGVLVFRSLGSRLNHSSVPDILLVPTDLGVLHWWCFITSSAVGWNNACVNRQAMLVLFGTGWVLVLISVSMSSGQYWYTQCKWLAICQDSEQCWVALQIVPIILVRAFLLLLRHLSKSNFSFSRTRFGSLK